MLQNSGMNVSPRRIGVALGLLGLGAFCSAHAALSGDASSVRTDQIELQGTVAPTHFRHFELQTISADNGLVVREFLTPSGTVFAIGWSGPVMPDLRRLLGAHYAAYLAAIGQIHQPGLKRSLRLETAGLVFENGGHLRAFQGRAFVPRLWPQGVAIGDLPW